MKLKQKFFFSVHLKIKLISKQFLLNKTKLFFIDTKITSYIKYKTVRKLLENTNKLY